MSDEIRSYYESQQQIHDALRGKTLSMKSKLNTYLAALATAAVVLGGSTAFASPNREVPVRYAKRATQLVTVAITTGQNWKTVERRSDDSANNSRVAGMLRSYRPRP